MKALAYTLFSVWGYLPRRGSQMCGIVCGTIEKSRLETNISRRFSGIEVTGLELYTMLLVIKNIAVYCYIFCFVTYFFYYFIHLRKKVCTFSVYFLVHQSIKDFL